MNRQHKVRYFRRRSARRHLYQQFSALTLSLLVPSLGWALGDQVEPQINAAISVYFEEQRHRPGATVEVDVQPLDQRLQFTACDMPLTLSHRPSSRLSGRLTMKVRCNDDNGWLVHVPVNVKLEQPVVVITKPVPRGAQLNVADLALVSRDVSNLNQGYYEAIADLHNMTAKRPLRAGQILEPGLVDAAKLVKKGEKVVIRANSDGLSIHTTAVALEDGALGELIELRNPSSNRVVEGRIIGSGQVQVSL